MELDRDQKASLYLADK